LVPTLTVAENVTLGSEVTRNGQLDRERAEREVLELGRRTGMEVGPQRRVADLTVGEAQRVEILKALFRGAKILILDEPTAVLSPPEVEELWTVLRRMRAAGQTIVLITHKLDEVMQISDSVTVMQQGRTVARMSTAATTPAEIARAMVGRDVVLASGVLGEAAGISHASGLAPQTPARTPLLSVADLVVKDSRRGGRRSVNGVSFEVAAGEILGIAGVEGNGQTELVDAIAGLRVAATGTISIDGRDVTAASVRGRGGAGLAHIPEDRQLRGLILDYSIIDNLILGQHHRFATRGVLDRHRMLEYARQQIAAFDIRPADPAVAVRTLSGGNQQKVVIAREMGRPFRVLLAAQPTRGVDVGAIEMIHARLRDARAAGAAIVLVSADLTEILALADRIAVMYDGRLATVLPRAEANAQVLGPYMTGATRDQAA